jgi:hypothetical protein
MSIFEQSGEDSELQSAITEAFREIANMTVDSDEYAKSVDQLVKLYSLKETPKRISPDTLAMVAGNLLGIVIIVGYERKHVVTSKALNFILKLR